jgi:hypothetical protein
MPTRLLLLALTCLLGSSCVGPFAAEEYEPGTVVGKTSAVVANGMIPYNGGSIAIDQPDGTAVPINQKIDKQGRSYEELDLAELNRIHTVDIWNGTSCFSATRTPDQLRTAESLTTFVMQDGQIKPFRLYAENVPADVKKKLFKEGGTLVLNDGQRIEFPAGMDPTRAATISVGAATLPDGRKINTTAGTFSGPLPKLIAATSP